VKSLRPTAIIGVAAVGGAFTEDVVRTMAALNNGGRFACRIRRQNPNARRHAYRWSDGRAVRLRLTVDPGAGRSKLRTAAGQQLYIFPALTWGPSFPARAASPTKCSGGGRAALAEQVTENDLRRKSHPPLKNIRDVCAYCGRGRRRRLPLGPRGAEPADR
jgi:malate dehydrogenase (oxaloacetate-decarboxylating)(NADP+)